MNGSEIVPFTCVRSETGAWQSLHANAAADAARHHVLLVRAHRALRGQRLAARPERRRRVHALGAVAGRAAAPVHLDRTVDVLAAREVDPAAGEHGARVAAAQSVLCGCGNGGGAPWQEPHAVGPAETAVHVGAMFAPPAASVAPWQ